MARRQKREALAERRRGEASGKPPKMALVVTEFTDEQKAIVKEHGLGSPLLLVSLIGILRATYDDERERGLHKDWRRIESAFWVPAGTREAPEWRCGRHPNGLEVSRARIFARKHTLGAVLLTTRVAPDGHEGVSFTLDHDGWEGHVRMDHFAETAGWRIFDGEVRRGEMVWTKRKDE